MGLGTAYIAGFKWAIEHCYERVLEMDANFCSQSRRYPPSDFGNRRVPATWLLDPAMWAALESTTGRWAELVIESSAVKYVRALTGLPLSDPTAGFKCFRIEVLQALDLDRESIQGGSLSDRDKLQDLEDGISNRRGPGNLNGESEVYPRCLQVSRLEALWVVCRLALQNGLSRTAKKHEEKNLRPFCSLCFCVVEHFFYNTLFGWCILLITFYSMVR